MKPTSATPPRKPAAKPPRGPESPLFRRWAELVLRHPWVVLGATFLMCAAAAWGIATRLTMDMTIESFMDNKSSALLTLEEYRDQFGRDDAFIVQAEGDVFSADYLERLRKLHEELATLDMEIPSLGQRMTDRGGAAPSDEPPPPAVAAPDAPAAEDTPSADDAFGDFEDTGSGDDATLEDANSAWADESGGSVVDQIISLVNFRRTSGKTVTDPSGRDIVQLKVGKFLDPWPADDAARAALRDAALNDPKMVDQVVSHDGTISAIVLRTEFMSPEDLERVADELHTVLARHSVPGFKLSLSGLPELAASLNRMMQREIRNLFVLAFAAQILMMFFLFRHPVGIFGPLAVVGLAAAWTFGFMAFVGTPVTMLSNVLPAFIIAVGIGDSVHVQSVYRDARRRGLPNHEAIVSAVAATGKPVLFTTLTTMFGLLSLNYASMKAVNEMGTAGAIGVVFALVNTVTILPVMLSWNRKGLLGAPPKGHHDLIDRFLDVCGSISGRPITSPAGTPVDPRRRRLVLVVAFALTAVAGYGVSQLRVWHNPLSWIPAGDPTKVAFETTDERLGGAASVQLLIRTKTDLGMKDLELLRGLEALEKRIRAYQDPLVPDLVGASISLLDVVKETNRALHGGDQAYYRLPDTQAELADTLFLFENASPSELHRLASADLKTSQMSLRVRWLEATSYGPFTKDIDAAIVDTIGDRAEIKTTGAAYTLFATVSALITDLLRSFAVAFVVITLLMIVLLRDIRLGLVAMVPNLLPIIYIMGFMGYANVPIDMSNLLIASIAIGLAVDDTIHLLHRYKVNLEAHGNVEDAINEALHHSGRAMTSTSLILAVGFFTYMGASLISLQRFGYLIGLTALLALVLDLIFGPALLRSVYARKPRPSTLDQENPPNAATPA
ncbi:MAG: MMPL family transporter [Myxococcota bacterium]